MNPPNPESALWTFVDHYASWWWYLRALLCLAAIGFILKHRPEYGFWRMVALYTKIVGLAALALAPLNSGLSPFGTIIFFSGYTLFCFLRMRDHNKRGVARPMKMQNRTFIEPDLSGRHDNGHGAAD